MNSTNWNQYVIKKKKGTNIYVKKEEKFMKLRWGDEKVCMNLKRLMGLGMPKIHCIYYEILKE